MELARDMAAEMAVRGEGVVLDQFGNTDNPLAHFNGTGEHHSKLFSFVLQASPAAVWGSISSTAPTCCLACLQLDVL